MTNQMSRIGTNIARAECPQASCRRRCRSKLSNRLLWHKVAICRCWAKVLKGLEAVIRCIATLAVILENRWTCAIADWVFYQTPPVRFRSTWGSISCRFRSRNFYLLNQWYRSYSATRQGRNRTCIVSRWYLIYIHNLECVFTPYFTHNRSQFSGSIPEPYQMHQSMISKPDKFLIIECMDQLYLS